MQNLLVSFSVVAPLLILMLIGALMLRTHIWDEITVKKMNAVVFKVFLPLLIFNNLYRSGIDDVKDIGTGVYAGIFLACAYIISMLIIPLIEKEPKKCGVMVQGMCRSNFVIFGVPLCQSLFGEQILGKISVAVAIVVPIINIFAVVVLEYFRGGKPSFKKMLKGILTNPLIISSLLGITVLLSGIKLPQIIENAVNDVSKIATPFALILLGASVNLRAVRGNLRQLIITIAGKLVLLPLAGISIAALMGLRGENIALLIAAFASPTAVSSYPMALQMEGDGELAAQIVAFGTTLCIITVFLWVFVLKQLGLI